MLVVGASRISQRGAPTFKGSTHPRGYQPIIPPKFPENYMEMKKIGWRNRASSNISTLTSKSSNPFGQSLKFLHFSIFLFHETNVAMNLFAI